MSLTDYQPYGLNYYGLVDKIPVKKITLPLDIVIPGTFFMITAISHLIFGKYFKRTIHNEDW